MKSHVALVVRKREKYILKIANTIFKNPLILDLEWTQVIEPMLRMLFI